MIDSVCRLYWDNEFFHTFFFGFIGPLAGVLLVFAVRKFLKSFFWLKALGIYAIINLASCATGREANVGCQILMFGEVNDDPGDLGIVFFTLPLFVLCFLLGLGALFYLRARIRQRI